MSNLSRRSIATGLAALLTASLGVAFAPTASAAQLTTPAPTEQRSASTVTAQQLPTAQIDSGVVWAVKVNGDTAYAGGKFTAARPAGALPGVNTVPRSNLLAIKLSTGALTNFAPVVNGQVKALALSPDGSRLYVGGSFNQVDGKTRWNIAAFDTATGTLLNTFKPAVGGSYVNAITATSSTVYVGGLISAGNGTARTNLMAFDANTGALTSWAPTADLQVDAMVMTPAADKVIIGGRFGMVNGATQRGLAALDPSTGTVISSWIAPTVIKDGTSTGTYAGKAGIYSLSADSDSIYATGWVFSNAATGNMEGSARIDAATGAVTWMSDCHGDQYSAFSDGTNVYVAGHPHDCMSIGGYPDKAATYLHHTLGFTKEVKGTVAARVATSIYTNWGGQGAPALINWFPDWTTGTATGQGQAAWTIDGGGDYLVVGGEFPYVNSKTQQGLVRFGKANVAGSTSQGPRLSGADWTPTAASSAAGLVSVTIPGNWDRDDQNLTYKFYRDNTLVSTVTRKTNFWTLPAVAILDSTATPGATYNYKVVVSDADGNSATSATTSVTVASSGTLPDYTKTALADGATLYWPLGQTGGTTDLLGLNNGTAGSGVSSPSGTGALGITGNGANSFTGSNSNSSIGSSKLENRPGTFTVEGWFKTSTNRGGKIFGYGSSQTGSSSNNDRHVYMSNNGKLNFGIYNNLATQVITTSASYNNGAWHYLVATLDPASGMALYVDGALAASGVNTVAQNFDGYWRVGGDAISGWPNNPSSAWFNGSIDEFAVYPIALSADQIKTHYQVGKGLVAPTAAFTSSATDLTASFDASTSVAGSAPITGYAWNFGDGTTGTGVTANHTYATGGTFPVTLTVTDSVNGLAGSVTQSVTVTAPHVAPTAAFTSQVSGLTASVDASTSTASDGDSLSYAWDFGDGSTGTGVTAQHKYATAGSYTITLTVTDTHLASATTTGSVSVLHAAPVADFSSTATSLSVAFDAGASTASDGDSLSYAWDFGDGSTGTGKTPTHKYAASGTYSVVLTVTDEHSATDSKTVSVSPVHTDPSVGFTTAINGLQVGVDASNTTLSDGATPSYAWDFGDGGTGTGVTSTHTYSAAGTYQVKVTVTDSLGGSASKTASVSVSAVVDPTVVVARFGTAVSAGWGSADTGGAWTVSDKNSIFSVTGGVGRITQTAGSTRIADLKSVSATNVSASVNFALDNLPVGGTQRFYLDLRKTSAGAYRIRADIAAGTGEVTLRLARVVSGSETVIASKVVGNYVAGTKMVISTELSTDGTKTTFRAKAWPRTDDEPTTWAVVATDSTAALQNAGAVAVQTYLGGAATTIPVVSVDDLLVNQL